LQDLFDSVDKVRANFHQREFVFKLDGTNCTSFDSSLARDGADQITGRDPELPSTAHPEDSHATAGFVGGRLHNRFANIFLRRL
jgi:hypothetical protein